MFTQFRETTAPLAAFLESVFGRPGLVLHGETAVGKRQPLVGQFQEDERVPFFVISLKAGGAGPTSPPPVVHFDGGRMRLSRTKPPTVRSASVRRRMCGAQVRVPGDR